MRFITTLGVSVAVASLSLTGCSASIGDDDGTESTSENALSRASVTTVRIVASSNGARRVELLGAGGVIVGRYFPGFFTASLLVPDVAGNSSAIVATRVAGTDVIGAEMNPRTGVVAVAVRAFIYAEVSTDMVYLFDTRDAAFVRNPYATPKFLPFDGRSANGALATASDGTRPFLDIRQGGIAYDSAGRLVVKTADASGGEATLSYTPDLRVAGCVWRGGESRRCPGS